MLTHCNIYKGNIIIQHNTIVQQIFYIPKTNITKRNFTNGNVNHKSKNDRIAIVIFRADLI